MTDNIKYKMLYNCEIHGKVKAKVIQILNDKVAGMLTISLCCPLCDTIKNLANERQAKKRMG